jgi:hypothetical protein
MRRVAFYQWLVPDIRTGQLVRARHLMDDAAGRAISGARKLPHTLEWRWLPSAPPLPQRR